MLLPSPATAAQQEEVKAAAPTPLRYGVDVSHPIHRTNFAPENVSLEVQALVNHRKHVYRQFREQWDEYFRELENDEDSPKVYEEERMLQNSEQPTMVKNFTETGFIKIPTPPEIKDLLQQFWDDYKDYKEDEFLEGRTSILNQFTSPTYLLPIGIENLDLGDGQTLRQKVWDALQQPVAEWTGQDLVGSSMYGIRVYTRGAMLTSHVDRLPLICSAIINVAQEGVDEPWPLEVIGRDGYAVNITMEPGEMILYESHSLIHGRPFALEGEKYANLFVHYEPKQDAANRKKGIEPSYIVEGTAQELVDRNYWKDLDWNNNEGVDGDGNDQFDNIDVDDGDEDEDDDDDENWSEYEAEWEDEF
jgi:hypothetical protein